MIVTDVGLEYFAKFLNFSWDGGPVPETTAIINKIRIGSGTAAESAANTDLATKYSDHGFEEATASTIEYADGKLHLQKVFTNGATVDREVWECGAFTSEGVCICRHVFLPYEVKNNNIVQVGQDITIDIYIELVPDTIVYDTPTVSGFEHAFSLDGTIIVSATVGDDPIDPSTNTCERGKICFNGRVLPNASPPVVTVARGAKTWEMSCYSDDLDEITALLAHQGLVAVGTSVTGYQYATSLQRYGTLKIWDKQNQTHTAYQNCLISGPISIDPFGTGWRFKIKIIQSYYGDL